MTWFYSQSTGVLKRGSELFGRGYAGNDEAGQCKNNPDAQNIHNHGPLPRGIYKIGTPYDHPKVGKFAIPLYPADEKAMFGRCGFFIHGDSMEHPGEASDGCIVISPAVREQIVESKDNALEVTE